jgi:Right handed beta helix region
MTLQRNRSLLLMAAIVTALSTAAYSATVAVGTCTNLAFYSSIQTAVNSVPAGSTIRICPGIYAEQVLITKKLTLTGVSADGFMGVTASGANNPTIVSPAAGVAVNASDLFDNSDIAAQIAVVTPTGAAQPILVNISNITVDGSNSLVAGCAPDLVGVYYQNASGTINHVATRFQELGASLFGCQIGLGIYVQSGYTSGGTSVTTIENSSVHDYQKNGITVDGSGANSTVMGNYVVGAGATPLIAQNGIQVSDGANGKVTNNTVTDDVYISPDGGPYFSATGILLYDSGGTAASKLVVSGNTVSNSQGGIVAFGDSFGTADYNTISLNKITTSPAAGPFLLDGIDLCSNNNTAQSNVVFNSSGSGIHIDSQCTEATGATGNNTTVTANTIDEACAGVLTGNGSGSSQSGNNTFSVLQTVQAGDSCPVSPGAKTKGKARPLPMRH